MSACANHRASRRKRIAFRLGALLLSLAVGIIGAEAALRVYLWSIYQKRLTAHARSVPRQANQELQLTDMVTMTGENDVVYRLKGGIRGLFHDKPLRTNKHGFRGKGVSRVKEPGTLRVMGLGDSYAFGWGVGDDETYLSLVEDSLNRCFNGSKRVEALNLGVFGYNAWMEVSLLEQAGLAFEPDVVLIQYNLNDGLLPNFLTDPPDVTRLDRLYLFNWPELIRGGVQMAIAKAAQPRMVIVDYRNVEDGPALGDGQEVPERLRHHIGMEAIRRAYERLSQICHSRGIKVFAVIPTDNSFSYQPDADRDPHFDHFRRLCREVDIPVIDTFPEDHRLVCSQGLKNDVMFLDPPRDWHPTPMRHNVYAQAILPPLAKALGGDAISSATLEAELARLRDENQRRIDALPPSAFEKGHALAAGQGEN